MKNKVIEISDNIRFLRENLNYSQEYVASQLEISQQAYSLIEKQPEKTSLKNLKQIAKILNVSVPSLILEDDHYLQQNFNQQNCNIASHQQISSNEAYEKLISRLENEIYYLRNLLEKKDTINISSDSN